MNQVLLQIWEESFSINKIRPNGCSLHLDTIEHKKYIDTIVNDRKSDLVPETYENFVGVPVCVFVNDVIYSILLRDKTIRLEEYEMNNLLGLKEIEMCK